MEATSTRYMKLQQYIAELLPLLEVLSGLLWYLGMARPRYSGRECLLLLYFMGEHIGVAAESHRRNEDKV